MKGRRTRVKFDGNNSIFTVDALYVTDAWDTDTNKLKYVFDVNKNNLPYLVI